MSSAGANAGVARSGGGGVIVSGAGALNAGASCATEIGVPPAPACSEGDESTRSVGAASASDSPSSHSVTTRVSIAVPAASGAITSISQRTRISKPGFTSVSIRPRCDHNCDVPKSSAIAMPFSVVLPGMYTARFDGTARSSSVCAGPSPLLRSASSYATRSPAFTFSGGFARSRALARTAAARTSQSRADRTAAD